MNDVLIFALVIRAILVTASAYNLVLAGREYRVYHDARGLRGFVGSLTMMFGVVALAATSPAIRDAWPSLEVPMRIVASAGVFGFIAGLLFSVYAWRVGRGDV
jgi:hypothetical protein